MAPREQCVGKTHRPDDGQGISPNLVDACLVPQIFNARRFKTDLTPFPKVTAMADRAAALPAFVKAAPPQA